MLVVHLFIPILVQSHLLFPCNLSQYRYCFLDLSLLVGAYLFVGVFSFCIFLLYIYIKDILLSIGYSLSVFHLCLLCSSLYSLLLFVLFRLYGFHDNSFSFLV